MVKKGTKRPRKLAKSDRFPLIDRELRKRPKANLIAMILEIAKEHAVVARELEDRLKIEKPVDLLVADVSSATCKQPTGLGLSATRNWQIYGASRERISIRRLSGG